ncbi:MAG: DUF721 domain-containing protein [Proteobacteria bacterium]|nr:DUF721 domain-containing protein [Pseudomonadota bacterium]
MDGNKQASVKQKVGLKNGVRLGGDFRRKRATAVGAVVAPLVEPALARLGVLVAQIVPHWGAICPLLASYSVPESVRGEVLTVAVASDAVRQEMGYLAPQIVESVNALVGYAAIERVRMVVRHELTKAPHGARKLQGVRAGKASVDDNVRAVCQNVRDDELRGALEKLGAQVKRTNRKA